MTPDPHRTSAAGSHDDHFANSLVHQTRRRCVMLYLSNSVILPTNTDPGLQPGLSTVGTPCKHTCHGSTRCRWLHSDVCMPLRIHSWEKMVHGSCAQVELAIHCWYREGWQWVGSLGARYTKYGCTRTGHPGVYSNRLTIRVVGCGSYT